ncbi:hypothetical protein COY28_06055 [Candidatus Woesearchaeota archaeon CG_4_10_14_0_2_um_filter_57_5]|nr:MAG: hypothetical protein COV94_06020 [Candidatus Woesearchaeota archaeon CG11_big_fil_rev_8_21_14_0_20_57_5]PIZ49799.1 MAG: hypothetical protein COY28_06055 [Candidatus Woesearchaeota archaeon CG_4_10_14_0_2_um_filter_57_5]
MRLEMSTLDVRRMAEELAAKTPARIQKVSGTPERVELSLYSTEHGKCIIAIEPNLIYAKPERGDSPQRPSGFVMALRKHIDGKFINVIRQHEFERIIIIEFPEHKLIAELFGQGNCIIIDAAGIILAVREHQEQTDRDIRPGKPYQYPQARFDPSQPFEVFLAALPEKNAAIKQLAGAGLGSQIANELWARLGYDKKRESLTRPQWRKVHDALQRLLSEPPRPCAVGGKFYSFTPTGVEVRPTATESAPADGAAGFVDSMPRIASLSDAILACLDGTSKAEAPKTKTARLVEKMQKTLEQQEARIAELESEAKEAQRTGEFIYEHYQEIQSILKTPKGKLEQHPKVTSVAKDRKSVEIELS